MSTITSINWSDNITDSRSVINTNFSNLNTDKLEASDIANFETTTQLNTRDTNNRARANHTWTQSADTITDWTTNKTYTSTEKTKLSWIEAWAEINTVDSVAWKTWVVTLDKNDVWLGNVSNTDTTTTANITDSTNKRFVTDAEKETVINVASSWILWVIPTITDNTDWTIWLPEIDVLIRATNSDTAPVINKTVPTNASLSLTDLQRNFIYVEYNSGTPQYIATTTQRTDENTNIWVASIYRNWTTLHINTTVARRFNDNLARIARRFTETQPFQRVTGWVTSEVWTRWLAITAGSWWTCTNPFSTTAFDTSWSDTFTLTYSNWSWWHTETAGQTQIPLQYDDWDWTPANLSTNRYGVFWIYLETDSDVVVKMWVLNTNSLATAQEAPQPTDIPARLTTHWRLIAKIIVRQSATNFVSITNAFDTTFELAQITDHNTLTNIQGWTTWEYYHLTNAEITAVWTIWSKANDNEVVKLTWNQTVAWEKIFSDKIAFGSTTKPWEIATFWAWITTSMSIDWTSQPWRIYKSRVWSWALNWVVNHLHSTTDHIREIFARAKSDTNSHSPVTNWDLIREEIYAGRATSDYYPCASIEIWIDSTWTISNTSMPWKIVRKITPDWSKTPVAFETVSNTWVVTHSQFTITPSSAPTTDYQIANKKYVDDNAWVTPTNAVTLTNKRITQRVASTTDDATAVIDSDSYDEYYLTAIANDTEISITGTPTEWQTIFIGLKDAGVTKALTWTGITWLGQTLPTDTTAGKQHIIWVKRIAGARRAIAINVEA